MNIETLSEGLYDDSNGFITSVRLSEDGEILVTLECDDWSNPQKRRSFTITCKHVLESDLSVGSANALAIHQEHPLLLGRIGKQGSLYFSSRPEDPHQIYADIWDILSEKYKGWAVPSELMNHSPSSFHTLLAGGYGLLLSGPISVLASIQARIETALNTQLIETHAIEIGAVVLTIEDHFAICKGFEVVEHGV
jgi:hypothetical protein